MRKAMCIAVACLLLLSVSGCGTLLYPERQGQEKGEIDPVVLILDGAGCLFFVVPGLIAFIVDLSTGAIYLPPEGKQEEKTKDNDDLVMIGRMPFG